MLRYVLDFRGHEHTPDAEALDRAAAGHAARLERSRRGRALGESEEPGRAAAARGALRRGLPAGYRNAYGPAEAARDIERLRQLSRARSRSPARPRRAALLVARGDAAERAAAEDLSARRFDAACPTPSPRSRTSVFACSSELPTELGGGERATIHDFRLRPSAARIAPAAGPSRDDRAGDLRRCSTAWPRTTCSTAWSSAPGLSRAGGRLAARTLPLPAAGEHRLHDLHGGRRAARARPT